MSASHFSLESFYPVNVLCFDSFYLVLYHSNYMMYEMSKESIAK